MKSKWRTFVRGHVIYASSLAQQQAAYRQLVEARERLDAALRKLDDIDTIIKESREKGEESRRSKETKHV